MEPSPAPVDARRARGAGGWRACTKRHTRATIAFCAAVLLSGCAVTDRMDEMNGRMREMNNRMARMNDHLEEMSQAVAKLDQTNEHLATMSDQARSMDKRLGTIEQVARKFGGMAGISKGNWGDTERRAAPERRMAKAPPPPPAAPAAHTPAEPQAAPHPLPILIPPAVISAVPEDQPKREGLRVTTLRRPVGSALRSR